MDVVDSSSVKSIMSTFVAFFDDLFALVISCERPCGNLHWFSLTFSLRDSVAVEDHFVQDTVLEHLKG